MKNLLKRLGVTDGFFFIRVLRLGLLSGLLFSSEGKAKLTCCEVEGRSGVRSIGRAMSTNKGRSSEV